MASKKTTKKTATKAPAKRPSAKASAKKTAKKAAAKKAPAKKPSVTEEASKTSPTSTKSQAAKDVASRVLAGDGDKSVGDLGDDLVSGKKSVAAQAGRVLDEIVNQKPEAVVPIIDRYAVVIGKKARRPAQSAAHALPVMARVAPARVARHLPKLKECFDEATDAGKDGLVRTFAGLCTASVAYQKRLEDVLNKALREADAKTLIAWTEVVLPALKGEPHARARATVEGRLDRIPRAHAQKIADFLGIKLRLRYR
ncbi:MAG: hypothetical protein VYE22_10775 [Myxococcota bacterium]|nr:hypothetical protein [Myxococcota bacterium]